MTLRLTKPLRITYPNYVLEIDNDAKRLHEDSNNAAATYLPKGYTFEFVAVFLNPKNQGNYF